MASYRIVGGHRLAGRVRISGSKNAALGVVAAAMAVDGPSEIENLPEVSDIQILLEICRELGAEVEFLSKGTVRIDPRPVKSHEALLDMVRELRGSYYLLGAFLGRFAKVRMFMPGGCDFGSRPIDLHLKGFRSLGADWQIGQGIIQVETEALRGAGIFLDQVSVGATINIMLAAIHAEGTTVIDNAAREPHIVDVANFLNTMGANVRGAGTDVIRIQGRPVIPGGKSYAIIPDQIEAGTYMMMAPLTHGDIVVENVIPKHMEPLSAKLEEMGVTVEEGGDWIRCSLAADEALAAVSFKTMPYPGFPTDLQPQATVLLTVADGAGRMIENVWENRFQYVENLRLMGAQIVTSGKMAVVQGGEPLSGSPMQARDLRAGAAVVMAALAAEGESVISDIHIIERGYEDFVAKLRGLGAVIEETGRRGVYPAW